MNEEPPGFFGKAHVFGKLRELLGTHLRQEQEANPDINSVGLIDQAGKIHWTLIPDGDLESWIDELLFSMMVEGADATRTYQRDLMKYRATPTSGSAFMVVIMPLGSEPQAAPPSQGTPHRGLMTAPIIPPLPATRPVLRETTQTVRPAGMPAKRMAARKPSPTPTTDQPATPTVTPTPPAADTPPAPPTAPVRESAAPPRAAPAKKMAGANRPNKSSNPEHAYRIWRFHDWLWNTSYNTFNLGRFAKTKKKILHIWQETDQRIKPAHKENYAVYVKMLAQEYEPNKRESVIGRDPIRKLMLKEIHKADAFARTLPFPDPAAYEWALDRDRFAEFHAFLWGVKGHAGSLETLAATDKKIQKAWDDVANNIPPGQKLRFDHYVHALTKAFSKAGLWGVPESHQKILAEITNACHHVLNLPPPD